MTAANFGLPIDWPDYFTTAVTISVLYEVAVVLYFSNRTTGKTMEEQAGFGAEAFSQSAERTPASTVGEEDANTATDRQALAQRLADYIGDAAVEGAKKGELLLYLRHVIQQYPGVKGTREQADISALLSLSLENNCGVSLSAEELEGLWGS